MLLGESAVTEQGYLPSLGRAVDSIILSDLGIDRSSLKHGAAEKSHELSSLLGEEYE